MCAANWRHYRAERDVGDHTPPYVKVRTENEMPRIAAVPRHHRVGTDDCAWPGGPGQVIVSAVVYTRFAVSIIDNGTIAKSAFTARKLPDSPFRVMNRVPLGEPNYFPLTFSAPAVYSQPLAPRSLQRLDNAPIHGLLRSSLPSPPFSGSNSLPPESGRNRQGFDRIPLILPPDSQILR